MIPVVHHPDYVAPARPGNAYSWNKNGLIREALLESEAAIDWFAPEPMPRRWLEAVHCPDYVAEVAEARVPPEKERRIGFPVDERVARRALRVPGGTYLAALTAKARGYAANSAGGSHHALHDSGAGYCVLNDLAAAAVRLVGEGEARRVLIVDCDVHQGDGTAALTAGRPGIATYSIHAEKNFPARKARSTVDVALPDGVGDAAYLARLRETLLPLVEAFRPDIILYQAGVDPLAGDRLGRLSLTPEGLDARDRWVAELARRSGVALASTPGGGYGDLMAVARAHVRTMLTIGAVFGQYGTL
ncbi:MAG: histone deacetylase [Allosphingosinicella sp.]|uniref:histone deacetylase family protein n=1 Tax=Allosphingosinicella sp. TaxID=2823234 RepID=UPI003935FA4F